MVDAARLVAAHETARALYRHQLHYAPGPRRYLEARGFAALVQPDTGEPWHLGYAPPGRSTLVVHLTHAGYTRTELLSAGLATTSRTGALVDLFRDRIMFPVHNCDGQPVGFLGRAAPGADPDVPKYLNTPETPIYHKGQNLYGLGEQRHHGAAGWAPVIVEGPTDVIAVNLAHAGCQPAEGRFAVATCGTALTAEQVATIAALPGAAHGITTAYDDDPAGALATGRALDLLPAHLLLRAATLPRGSDPGDLTTDPAGLGRLRDGLGPLSRPLAQAVIDFETERVLTRHPDALVFAEGRVGVVRHLADRVAHLPPKQIGALVDHIAARTGATLDVVTQVVIDILEQPAPDAGRGRPPPGPEPPTHGSLLLRPRPFPPLAGAAGPATGTLTSLHHTGTEHERARRGR